jgi:hypothetical protein
MDQVHELSSDKEKLLGDMQALSSAGDEGGQEHALVTLNREKAEVQEQLTAAKAKINELDLQIE